MQYLLAGVSALLNCCCASDVLMTSCIRVAWRCSTSEMLVQAYAIAWMQSGLQSVASMLQVF